MITKTTNYFVIILIMLLTWSCNKEVLEVKDPVLKEDILKVFKLKQSITLGIFDVTTGEPIGVRNVIKANFNISGKDGNKVTTYEGIPTTNVSSESGFVTISSTKEGTSFNPLDINIIAQIAGYISKSKRVKTYENGQEVVKIYLEKIPSNAKKVTVKVDNQINISSGDTTKSSYNFETNINENTSKTNTSVFIFEGTALKDNSNKALSGQIKSTLLHFDMKEESSLAAFPGGFVTNALGKDGINRTGTFASAGFFNLEMIDGSGNEVKTLSKASYIQTTIPANTTNPITGSFIKNSDVIDIWSYDQQTGNWKYLFEAEIQQYGTDFKVVFSSDKVSYYNLGWFKPFDPCGNPSKIAINAPDLTTAEYLEFEITIKNSGLLFNKQSIFVKDSSQITIYQAPNEEMEIKALGKLYTGALTFSGCNDNKILKLDKNKPSNTIVTITADISGTCGKTTIKQSGVVFVYKADVSTSTNSSTKFVKMVEGKVTIPDLEKGATYTALFYHNGFYHSRTFKVEENKTHYELSGELLKGCN